MRQRGVHQDEATPPVHHTHTHTHAPLALFRSPTWCWCHWESTSNSNLLLRLRCQQRGGGGQGTRAAASGTVSVNVGQSINWAVAKGELSPTFMRPDSEKPFWEAWLSRVKDGTGRSTPPGGGRGDLVGSPGGGLEPNENAAADLALRSWEAQHGRVRVGEMTRERSREGETTEPIHPTWL